METALRNEGKKQGAGKGGSLDVHFLPKDQDLGV